LSLRTAASAPSVPLNRHAVVVTDDAPFSMVPAPGHATSRFCFE
jgi:hypothetical protein